PDQPSVAAPPTTHRPVIPGRRESGDLGDPCGPSPRSRAELSLEGARGDLGSLGRRMGPRGLAFGSPGDDGSVDRAPAHGNRARGLLPGTPGQDNPTNMLVLPSTAPSRL